MLSIACPHCGPRAHTEFTYAGDATLRRPPAGAPLEQWVAYVYLRDNPRGPHRELWQHTLGCRAFITVVRDTLTHAISETGLPQPAAETVPHTANAAAAVTP